MTMVLVAGVVMLAGGGLALLFGRRWPRAAQKAGTLGVAIGACLGLPTALWALLQKQQSDSVLTLPWMTPLGGSFAVALDSLSAFFLVPVLGFSALAALYGSAYMKDFEGRKNLGAFWFFFAGLVASMIVVVVARNGLLFLAAWEVMALSSYFLVTFESEKEEVCRAGWVYLVATHLGALFLLVFFVLSADPDGNSLDFGGAAWALPPRVPTSLLFGLAVVGFGSKAGLVPLHVWLPEAHPAAPSHVSALMSAVMIKLGIYGLLRTLILIGPPERWWGLSLMAIGLGGALIGIGQALYQRDLKRVLAYSSVENIGLIAFGIGLGMWGWADAHPGIAALGFAGALLHIWNHALLKGMMFLAAGSVVQATHTRDIEMLGGLMKRMPWTASLFMVGAAAMAGLPPFNMFVSEWLIYLGLLQSGLVHGGGLGLAAVLAVGGLAIVGGLAAIAFVRLAGIVCLGEPRSEMAANAHESSLAMRVPMLILGAFCLFAAAGPALVLSMMSGVLDSILRSDTLAHLEATGVSPQILGWINCTVAGLIAALAGLLVWLVRKNGATEQLTWDCGFVAPSPRMQYTGRSFAEIMAESLLPRPFRPRISRSAITGLFPKSASFEADCSDPVEQRGYARGFDFIGRVCMRLWWVQHGTINLYLFYLLLAVVMGLTWMSARDWWGFS
jgi:formate hydrogenlyase subunit 3/multisubunit Na+/H+ antiporter MnhD subunit